MKGLKTLSLALVLLLILSACGMIRTGDDPTEVEGGPGGGNAGGLRSPREHAGRSLSSLDRGAEGPYGYGSGKNDGAAGGDCLHL